MLVRYVDGPFKGTTAETTADVIEAVFDDGGGKLEAVSYIVNPRTRTACLLGPTNLRRIRDASTSDLLNELTVRAAHDDKLAARSLTDFTTPMRRGRRPFARIRPGQQRPPLSPEPKAGPSSADRTPGRIPRAGFGSAPWPGEERG